MRRGAWLLALFLAAPAAAQDRTFTFRDAEFMAPAASVPRARRFVSERFPPGLPMPRALDRARRAQMTCRPVGRNEGSQTCRYSVPVHADGGVIGDDTWTLSLVADGHGALASATLAYDRGSGAVE